MFRKPKTSTKLDEAIDALLEQIAGLPYDPKETPLMIDQVSKLEKLRSTQAPRVSPDTLMIVGGNILGIVLILHFERVNVVTSKALAFVMKLR
jgi:hypothetical protein